VTRKYPPSWKTVKLESVSQFFNGKPLEGRVIPDGNTNLITLDSVDIKGQLKNKHKKINSEGDFLKAGDIVSVLSDIAHGYLLGLSAVIPVDDRYVLNQRMGLLRTSSEIDPNYLRLFINFNQTYFRERGQGTSQRHIYKRDFYDFDFSYPPLTEQKAIAKALSDIDELIAGLKIEIEKNENIKTGLVQKNLNPLVPNSKLRDHATMASGGTPLTSVSTYYGGEIPWVSITDMTDSGKYIERTARNLTESGLLNSSAVIYPVNTLLFAMYASIGKCALPKVPVTSSQAILGITVKPSLNIDFLYYILTSRTQDFIAMGQQGTQSNLNKIIVGDLNIPVLPLKDQEIIAGEFIAIDLKIETLKSELAKYECIKQGMAHDLLTGKVKLV
jgi:type I restriction enzyme S subunit